VKTYYVLDLTHFCPEEFVESCLTQKAKSAANAAELWVGVMDVDPLEVAAVLVADNPEGKNAEKYELSLVEYVEAIKVEDE
jgi:hypothetical protein